MTQGLDSKAAPKKILEKSPGGSLVIPIAIVLVGALIIFGVTKMLSTDRSYKDLVREMHSKTFGNRWVAAYELSKLISAKKIPQEEYPWLVTNLKDLYNNSQEPRTKEFLVVALASLQDPAVFPFLMNALEGGDEKIKFHVLAAIGNFPPDKALSLDWTKVTPFLASEDQGLVQVAMFALATHKVAEAESRLVGYLGSENQTLRYSAASALVFYGNEKAFGVVKEIFSLVAGEGAAKKFTVDEVAHLKLNVLRSLEKTRSTKLNSFLEESMKSEKNIKVVSKARDVLNQLKN